MIMKKGGKTMELTNSTQIETWRQRLATENRIMKDRDQKAIEKHVDLLDTKNTYFNIYKKEEVKKKEEEDEVTKSKYGFDMTHEHDAVENKTWQKRKYGSQWAPEREKKPASEVQYIPATSAQEYGWREPIDTFNLGLNKSGVCKKTFYDNGHLG